MLVRGKGNNYWLLINNEIESGRCKARVVK